MLLQVCLNCSIQESRNDPLLLPRWASVDAVADRVRLGNRIRTYLPQHLKSPRSRCAYFELPPSARLSYPPPQA